MKIIDADKLHYKQVYIQTEKELRPALVVFAKEIRKMPEIPKIKVQVDPVKHGHWIEVQRIHEKDHTAICECSLCGDTVWVYDGQRAWNYCPNCGAKMEVSEWLGE